MIIFDRQAGPFQNFNRSHVMVTGISVPFSDPARPPGGGVGRPKIPPPQKKYICVCVSEPQGHFFFFNLVGKKNFEIMLYLPLVHFGVLRPQEHFFAKNTKFLLLKTSTPPPPPRPRPRPALRTLTSILVQ